MKTLVQLARDKVAEDLFTNHRSTEQLVKVLPVELLNKVAAALRKKLAEDAIRSGDVNKLAHNMLAVMEYVNRLERKWADYGAQLLAFANNVDQLRKKMKATTYNVDDLKKDEAAFKVLQKEFVGIKDRRKKMVVLIGKLRAFVDVLEQTLEEMRRNHTPAIQPLMDAISLASARFERLLDRLHDVVLGGVDKAERQMVKIEADLKERLK